MTTAVQHRRGTTAEHAAFTGLEGELTIDTTKDTAVIHDGTLAGGYPLAKENLANVTTSGLSSIDGASTASDDKFFIYDQSATSLKTITRAELNNAIEQDALANVAITGGTINGTTIGGTTAAAVSATTLTTSSTVTHNGGTANSVCFLNGSKVLTTGSALTFDGSVFGVAPATGVVARTKQLVLNNFTGEGVGITFSRTSDDTEVNAIGTANSNWDMGLFARENILFAVGGGSTYSATAEQMRLTSTGLGIGTSSPAARFVVSNGGANGYEFDPANSFISSYNRSTSAWTAVTFRAGGYTWNINNSNDALKLDASGNFGLGVTPSAWTSYKALQLSGSAYLYGFGNDELGLGQGAYYSSGWKYAATGVPATWYSTYRGTHIWQTAPSGTAGDAISFTQAMTLTAAGDLGIGTTSPQTRFEANQTGVGSVVIPIVAANQDTSTTGTGAGIGFVVDGVNDVIGAQVAGIRTAGAYHASALAMYTRDAAGSGLIERARIDSSGNFLLGTTGTASDVTGFRVFSTGRINASDSTVPGIFARLASDGECVRFQRDGTDVGSVDVTTTATTYNTSSDYRLKNITGPITTSGAYIDSLNPVEGTWKADGSTFVGLIAHEVQEASRTNVATGVKDGEEMQGMDYSSAEIIANLIAEVKSLRQRLAAAGI